MSGRRAHWDVTLHEARREGAATSSPPARRRLSTPSHVVTATGNHGRSGPARLLGIKIPRDPRRSHQYIVTEPDPALVDWRKAGNPEHPVLRDADAQVVCPGGGARRLDLGALRSGRAQRDSNMPCPRASAPTSSRSISSGSRRNTCPSSTRIPSSEEVGLKDDYNGPICLHSRRQPASRSPHRGSQEHVARRRLLLRHHGGRRGGALSRPAHDRGPRPRSTSGASTPAVTARAMTTEYAARKNEEAYSHVYILHHPVRKSARRAGHCAPRLPMTARRRRARSSAMVNGWERPNFITRPCGRLPDTFDHDAPLRSGRGGLVAIRRGRGPRRARSRRAESDATAFTKHSVTGPGAHGVSRPFTCNPGCRRSAASTSPTPSLIAGNRADRIHQSSRLWRRNDYYLISAGGLTAYDGD